MFKKRLHFIEKNVAQSDISQGFRIHNVHDLDNQEPSIQCFQKI